MNKINSFLESIKVKYFRFLFDLFTIPQPLIFSSQFRLISGKLFHYSMEFYFKVYNNQVSMQQDHQKFYQKGHLIDYCHDSYNIVPCVIEDIDQNCMKIQNLSFRGSSSIIEIIPLDSPKIKPFRTMTYPRQNFNAEKNQNVIFDPDYFQNTLKILRQLNVDLETEGFEIIKNKYTSVEIVQLLKGQIYYSMLKALNTMLKSNQEFEIMDKYFREFLKFVQNYLKSQTLAKVNTKELYESSEHSFALSYEEIFLNLLHLSFPKIRSHFIEINQTLCQKDYFHKLIKNWHNDKFSNTILSKNLQEVNPGIIEKITLYFLSLKTSNCLENNSKSIQSIQKIFTHASLTAHLFTQFNIRKIIQSTEEMAEILATHYGKQIVQNIKIRLKFALLVKKNVSSRNLQMLITDLNQFFTLINNGQSFKLISTLPELNIVIQKLCLLYGVSQNMSQVNLEYLCKFKSISPQMMLQNIVQYKRPDLFRKLSWSGPQLFKILSFMDKQNISQEDFIIIFQVFDHLTRQREVLIKGVIKNSLQIDEISQNINEDMQSEMLIEYIEQLKQNNSLYESRQIQTTKICEQLEEKILQLCDTYITADTPLIMAENIENKIIKKNTLNMKKYIQKVINDVHSNVFRQAYIIGYYVKKTILQLPCMIKLPNVSEEHKQKSVQKFKKQYLTLCNNMKNIKQKQVLQLRKQNIKNILLVFCLHFQTLFFDSLCHYLQILPSIENKEFKSRCVDFSSQLFNQSIFTGMSDADKITSFQKIMDLISLESQSLVIFYKQCFVQVNILLGNMIVNTKMPTKQQEYYPHFVINKLYGLNKFYEVLENIGFQKSIVRKIILEFIMQLIKSTYDNQISGQLQKIHLQFLLKQITTNHEFKLTMFKADSIAQYSSYLYKLFSWENQQIYEEDAELNHEDQQKLENLKQLIKTLTIQIYLENKQQKQQINYSGLRTDFSIGYYKYRASRRFGYFPIQMDLKVEGNIIKKNEYSQRISTFFKKKYQSNRGQNTVKLNLTMCPKQIPTPVSHMIMQNLDIIFLRLPFTEPIWEILPISAMTWQQNQSLLNIRKLFLKKNSSEQQEKYWKQIVSCHRKKQIMLRLLCNQQKLSDINTQELFNCISPVQDIYSIRNNQQIILILKNIDYRPDQQQAIQILNMLNISNQSPTLLKKLDNNYEYQKLIQLVLTYLQQNTSYDMFNFFMRMSSQFYNDMEQIFSLQQQFLGVWKVLFDKKSSQEILQFFQNTLTKTVFINPRIVEVFLKVLCEKNVNSDQMSLYGQILTLCVDQLKQKMQLETAKVLLKIIQLLLDKNIKSQAVYSIQFLSFIENNLYLKLGTQIVNVLGYLMKENKFLFEKYALKFQKDMNEPLWKDLYSIKPSKKMSDSNFPGIQNPHSVCYINSFLQQLFYIKQFRYSLFSAKWHSNPNQSEDLIYQLKKSFINLERRKIQSYLNYDFFQAFKNTEGEPTSLYIQMDVDEFRNILLQRIQNLVLSEMTQAGQNVNSKKFTHKIFNGKQETCIKGYDCSHESKREEEFSSICLDVKDIGTLSKSLQNYFQPQILDQQNSYYCEQCQNKVKAIKKYCITEYPQYLTFVLKRFQYHIHRQKINSYFEFPMNQLDMDHNTKYQLTGIIVHQGVSEGGHYVSYIKIQGTWYQFNDNHVHKISEQSVKNISYGRDTGETRNAYLLIYKKLGGNKWLESLGVDIGPEAQKNNHFQGLDKEIQEIQKYNNFKNKINIIFSPEFENFTKRICSSQYPCSYNFLFQFLAEIKIKQQIKNLVKFNEIFELLYSLANGDIIQQEVHIYWALKIYKNTCFPSTLKAGFTEIIERRHKKFSNPLKVLLANCLAALNQNCDSSPFFKLFLVLARKDHQILKFLVSNMIVAKILNNTIPEMIGPAMRKNIEKIEPPVKNFGYNQKRNQDPQQYKYYKWKLLNLVIKSNLKLHQLEIQLLFNNFNPKVFRIFFSEAISKANINEISKFMCLLSEKNQSFAKAYIVELLESIKRDNGTNLRKYMKAIKDLLQIDDNLKNYRNQLTLQNLAKTLDKWNENNMFKHFDIAWQWILKIAAKNQDFRQRLITSQQKFSVFVSKVNNCMMRYRPEQFQTRGDEKLKNRYHNLQFGTTTQENKQLLKQKIERTLQTFNKKVKKLHEQSWDSDEDLTEANIKKNSIIMKFFTKSQKFKEVRVKEVCGDLIEIDLKYQFKIDKGDDEISQRMEIGENLSNNLNAQQYNYYTQ